MPGTTPETAMYKVVVADTGIGNEQGISATYIWNIYKRKDKYRRQGLKNMMTKVSSDKGITGFVVRMIIGGNSLWCTIHSLIHLSAL